MGVRSHWTLTVGATGLALVLGLGAGAFAQSETDEGGSTDDESLVDRLVEIVDELPVLPPDDVEISDDETWADFDGDFTGAQIQLETLEGDIQALFVDADDADSETADAVAEVTRSMLMLGQAFDHLAEWESHDLELPLDESDDDGVATDADVLYGEAEAGLSLLLQAHELAMGGYETLADTEAADSDEQALFDDLASEEEAFRVEERVEIRRALSDQSPQVLVPVERFQEAGDGGRARSMTVTCVERDVYDELRADGALDDDLDTVESPPTDGCPGLPDDNDVAPSN